ncbi:MAG: amidohydrolase [Acidocella sp. 20-57-95]|nr:MAG: amidohydrolase [Acidocella sp. 20-57-95]OYV59709.1 MAG: amidohydrolase [Acidocella sp. 21-58-7]HQT64721.1 amidohydrolase [Acidocella sp.]HQU03513.1 amidohydrolase [Acidocella sp.]
MPLDFVNLLRHWRHHLHAHPELSLHESATAAFVCEQLDKLGIGFTAHIGGHGVVATISRAGSNRSVGLRADMDALPIMEATNAPYASQRPGVMHACGHDGHTASLLGAAKLLVEDHDWAGTVHLVFQPAEEGFGGADAMLKDGLLQKFPMERIFGYHNWPGLEAGTVMIHDGPIMAAASNFTITLHGKAAHAAMPHLSQDPVQGVAHLIIALNSIVARNADPLDTAVISTCKLQAGNANNQIPEQASLGGTYRALQLATMRQIEARIRDVAAHTAAAFGLSATVEIFGVLPPTVNDKAQADFAAEVAAGQGLAVRRDMAPSMGAEDFGCFLMEIPGAYAWIGNGNSANLHNPHFDYNDEILPIAAHYLAGVAKAALR